MPDDGQVMNQFRTTTQHAPLPALRAVVFTVVGTVLGVSAHHLVDGGPVPWRQSAAAAVVLFGVGLVGARRPRSRATVVATCAAAQAGLHLWLMTEHVSGSPTSGTGMSMGMGMPSHGHHAADVHSVWHERMHASTAMTAAHALAAVLVAVLLHRADAVCWSLARGLTAAVDAVRVRIATARSLLGDRPKAAGAGVRGPVVLDGLEGPSPQGAVLMDVVIRRGHPHTGLTLAN